MNPRDLTKANNGLSRIGLGHTAFNVYQRFLGLHDEWPPVQGDWEVLAGKAIRMMDTPGDTVRSISVQLASQHLRFFQPESKDEQLAWQLVVRHLVNCIMSDGTIPLADLEDKVLAWAKEDQPQPQEVS